MGTDKPFRLEVGDLKFDLTDKPPGTTPDDEDDLAQVLADWFRESAGPDPLCPVTIQVNDGRPRRYILRGITYPKPDHAVIHLEAEPMIEQPERKEGKP